jgi:hypothetical protein
LAAELYKISKKSRIGGIREAEPEIDLVNYLSSVKKRHSEAADVVNKLMSRSPDRRWAQFESVFFAGIQEKAKRYDRAAELYWNASKHSTTTEELVGLRVKQIGCLARAGRTTESKSVWNEI